MWHYSTVALQKRHVLALPCGNNYNYAVASHVDMPSESLQLLHWEFIESYAVAVGKAESLLFSFCRSIHGEFLSSSRWLTACWIQIASICKPYQMFLAMRFFLSAFASSIDSILSALSHSSVADLSFQGINVKTSLVRFSPNFVPALEHAK